MRVKTHFNSISSSPFSEKDPGLFSLSELGIFPLCCSHSKQPFEPISEIPLKLLTLKMVFLTFLASGARRGKIHAISYSTLSHAPNRANIVLCPILEFISKTLLKTKGVFSLEPIVIPSLGHTLGHDLAENRHLCPVRCLKGYLSRMKPSREGKRLLFISLQKNKSLDISQNTILGWVRSLLHTVCSNTTPRTQLL